DFTCTRHNRRRELTMKSKRSLSPYGLATPKPRLAALYTNASSANSPRRFELLRHAGRSLRPHGTVAPWSLTADCFLDCFLTGHTRWQQQLSRAGSILLY